MPGDPTSRWLSTAADGYCAVTDADDPGDCLSGSNGAWRIRASAARQLILATTACVEKCLACDRCRYISLSQQLKQCSWHHSCDSPGSRAAGQFRFGPLERLRGKGHGRGRGGRQHGGRCRGRGRACGGGGGGGGGGGSALAAGPCPIMRDRMEVQEMARMVQCLQERSPPSGPLEVLLRSHLWAQPPPVSPRGQCRPIPLAASLGSLGTLTRAVGR